MGRVDRLPAPPLSHRRHAMKPHLAAAATHALELSLFFAAAAAVAYGTVGLR